MRHMERLPFTKWQDSVRQAARFLIQKWEMWNSRGATAVEYALMLMFVAAVIYLAVTQFGQSVSNLFNSAAQAFK